MRERGNVLVIVGLAVTGIVLVSGLAIALLKLSSTDRGTSIGSKASEGSASYQLPTVAAGSNNVFGNLLQNGTSSPSSVTSLSETGTSSESAKGPVPTGVQITPVFIQPALTATLSSDKKSVTLTFDTLSGVRRVTYSVTYPTSSGDKGANGSFDVPQPSGAMTREVKLGTCSSGGTCSYDTVTGAITVRAVFTPIFGIGIEITKTLAY